MDIPTLELESPSSLDWEDSFVPRHEDKGGVLQVRDVPGDGLSTLLALEEGQCSRSSKNNGPGCGLTVLASGHSQAAGQSSGRVGNIPGP